MARSDGRFGVGIIGAHPTRGWALSTHLPALRASSNFRIAAVCAKEIAVAEAAAQVFAAPKSFANARELCRDPDVDVIVVCLRVPMHFEAVTAAIEAGKHVYCEWPLGRDLDEAAQMRDSATRAGVHAAVGLQGRTSPVIEKARSMIAAGDIGRPLAARLYSTSRSWGAATTQSYAYLSDRSTGATLLTITAGHSLDALCHIVGELESVSALLATQRTKVAVAGSERVLNPTAPDHVMLCGRHANGCVMSAHVAGGAPAHGNFLLDVIGEQGDVMITGDAAGDFQTGSLTLSGRVRGEAFAPWSDREDMAPLPSGVANVARIYERFAGDICRNTCSVANFADAVINARLLAAIERSSATGCAVRVASMPN